MKSARVVGAGISGLAAAWCLRDAGYDVEVIEAATSPGGLIGTVHTPHGLVERAANAFVWSDTTAHWFKRLGLEPVFPLPSSSRRFIYRDGKPRRWPLTRTETLVMGARLAVSFATRRLRPRTGESVDALVTRVAGRAAARWFVAPALQGVYATAARRLSAEVVFGGRRRLRGGSVAPSGGMGQFIARIHERLLERGVTFSFGAAATFVGGSVPTIICTSARHAAPLVRPHAAGLADALDRVEMAGLETNTAFFEKHAGDLEGFGVLFPAGTGFSALGALFNTSVFPHRGTLRSETWIYALPDDRTLAASSERMTADRALLTGRQEQPVAVHSTVWPAALPVYDQRILDVASRLDQLPPWLALSGNYLGQIGVSTLLARAEQTVETLIAGAAG
jgi:oxygen-dependent protoporphyrinogen oxidase